MSPWGGRSPAIRPHAVGGQCGGFRQVGDFSTAPRPLLNSGVDVELPLTCSHAVRRVNWRARQSARILGLGSSRRGIVRRHPLAEVSP